MATAALTACCYFKGGSVEGGSVEEEGFVEGGSVVVKSIAAAAGTLMVLPAGT
jgi:hypothetical protein